MISTQLKENFTVQRDKSQLRLDVLLSQNFSDYSRTQWQKIIETNAVSINDKTVTSVSYVVKHNDKITINFREPKRAIADLDIIYEDTNVIVIDKKANILVMDETFLSREPTIEDTLRREYESIELVHRLDRETSGVLVAARNRKTKKFLQDQFRNRSVKKHYTALVKGTPDPKQAIINWPIGRHTNHPLKWRVTKNGRQCITTYKVVAEYGRNSLLEVRPKTGRTHQIRVHMQHLGNPIVGDKLYGSVNKKLDRHFLHAERIHLTLPGGTEKTFKSDLPKELTNFLDTLK